ncbi:hypothetical protein B0H17DRAFT_1154106 [Mycena rosella]|uniref:Uncharacterized protein n=1 Tax=Mycena rosella TaxID=1033263 RepID=A0AAD7B0W0_MYCRO|nr:hypothetical protein B0H17DRAFT_1154106 [Mycena rosella]
MRCGGGYTHTRKGSGALRGREERGEGRGQGRVQVRTSIASDSYFEFDLDFDPAALGSSFAEAVPWAHACRRAARGWGSPARRPTWRRPMRARISDGEVQRRNGGRVSREKEEGTCAVRMRRDPLAEVLLDADRIRRQYALRLLRPVYDTVISARLSEAAVALVTAEDERRRIWKDRDTPVA